MKPAKRLLVAFSVVFVLPICCSFGTWRYLTNKRTIPVDQEVPEAFPLVAVIRFPDETQRCKPLYYKDLEALSSTAPNITFLVPVDLREECGRQLSQSTDFFYVGFQILSEAPGQQSLVVNATPDDDRVNTGWYVAREDHIVPQKYRHYFGPNLVMPIVFLGGPAWLILVIVLAVIDRRSRRGAA